MLSLVANAPAMVLTRFTPLTMMVSEETAKSAWLAKLQAPLAGENKVVPAAPPAEFTSEARAKSAWLAKLDCEPAWKVGTKGDAISSDQSASAAVTPTADDQSSEDAAKAAWLAKLDAQPAWKTNDAAAAGGATEDAAKAAWLAKLDAQPTRKSGPAAPSVSAVASNAITKVPVAGSDAGKSAEEAAKHAWLAKLSTPSWGGVMPASDGAEEEAKKAWLAKLAVPPWGKASPEIASLVEDCEQGDDEACDVLGVCEEELKNAWLSSLDMESFRTAAPRLTKPIGATRVATALETSATKIAALVDDCEEGVEEACNVLGVCEEEAKNAWLSSLDMESFRGASVRLTQHNAIRR